MRKQGFTLIELLVVTGINAMLAALLLPKPGKSQSQVRRRQMSRLPKESGRTFQIQAGHHEHDNAASPLTPLAANEAFTITIMTTITASTITLSPQFLILQTQ